jgi:hypothetical protein
MMVESFAYRDHRVDLYRLGAGWVAMIYAPGHDGPLPQMPVAPSEEGLDTIVKLAKTAIDRRHKGSAGSSGRRGLGALLATIGRRGWPAILATLTPGR